MAAQLRTSAEQGVTPGIAGELQGMAGVLA